VSNDHYRRTYYSETEAKKILAKNEKMMDASYAVKCKARNGIDDHKEAKALGMTIEEFRSMIQ